MIHPRSCNAKPRFLSTLSLRRATVIFFKRNTPHLTFLSTLSLRRATVNKIPYQRQIYQFLSTLSLRRATSEVSERVPLAEYFYPRSPCGERQGTLNLWDAHRVFLSTLSLRRATHTKPTKQAKSLISIHALLAESD